jgi:hypothetical protein
MTGRKTVKIKKMSQTMINMLIWLKDAPAAKRGRYSLDRKHRPTIQALVSRELIRIWESYTGGETYVLTRAGRDLLAQRSETTS